MAYTKKTAYKTAACALLLFCGLFLFAIPAIAAEEEAIHRIDIDVLLHSDGRADFTEVWDVSVGSGGEVCVPKRGLDGRVITGFSVTDESGNVFTDTSGWNSSWGVAEKQHRSSLVSARDGCWLYWGAAAGRHRYTLRYTMAGAVRGVAGADALYQQLVPKGLFAPARRVYVEIRGDIGPLNGQNTGVWAYGFPAKAGLEEGVAFFRSTKALKTNEYVSVLLRFEKGLFSPAETRDYSFEQLQAAARGGYTNPEEAPAFAVWLSSAGGTAVVALLLAALVPAGFFLARRIKKRRVNASLYDNASYHRGVPFRGSLKAAFFRLEELSCLDSDGDILNAYILRWVRTGQIGLRGEAGANVEDDTALVLNPLRPGMERMEGRLYSMLGRAAGEDGILRRNEFTKWARRNSQIISSWYADFRNEGLVDFIQLGCTKYRPGFLGVKRKTSHKGQVMTKEMFGFKKYLADFTILNERQAKEVQLWDDYLVYAALFGIADEVAAQFSELDPGFFPAVMQGLSGQAGPLRYGTILQMSRIFSSAMYTGYQIAVIAGENLMQAADYRYR